MGNKSNTSLNKSQKTGPSTSGSKREAKCKFCNKLGHTQHDCPKFKEWFVKKGRHINHMICESLSISVPSNTWWIDTGSMIHITNSLQGFHTRKILENNQRTIKVGDGNEKKVEAISSMVLLLDGGHEMVLRDTLYVPTITHNLIYVSKLKYVGYSF